MNIKDEISKINERAHRVYTRSSALRKVMIEDNESNLILVDALNKVTTEIEAAVLEIRRLHAYCQLNNRIEAESGMESLIWPDAEIAGSIEVDSNGWLHICLNTLLPHCKHGTNRYLSDTIARLLKNYRETVSPLPYYERALMVIDEHCSFQNRRVFDQDNKGWKAISNALKGMVIQDDDQYSLGIALVSTWDDTLSCNIHLMDIEDSGTFFALHYGDYGSYFKR